MTKKTLLVVSDAATAPTGFGRVAEAILDRLHDKGHWNIKQLGINFFDTDHDKPYRIFSATAAGNPGDWTGYERVDKIRKEVNPDAVLLFQDVWHIAQYITRMEDRSSIVTYFPIDAPNIKPLWTLPQGIACEVCAYTQFGAQEFSSSVDTACQQIMAKAALEGKEEVKHVNLALGNGETLDVPISRLIELSDPKNINIVPHGLDSGKFYPVDRKKARDTFNLPHDAFVVGNVNRNQIRKRLDLTIMAFAKFAKDKRNAILVMHDPLRSVEGWDLAQLAEYYGVKEKVLLSNQRHDLEHLNLLYNTFDVMVNSGGGEGWGLTTFESAACGTPQIVPNWSATKEIWEGKALLTDISGVRHMDAKINLAHCSVDVDHLASQLQFLYDNPQEAASIAQACYNETKRSEYDWDNIANTMDEILLAAAEQRYPEAKSVPLR